MLAVWLIPDAVMADARERAEASRARSRANAGWAQHLNPAWQAASLA